MPEYSLKMKFTHTRIEVDIAKYQAMLDAPDATEPEKREFLEALWAIMMTFVDLGFELHPLSLPCGQLDEAHGSDCAEPHHVLSLDEILKHNFEEVAADDTLRDGEESGHDS